MTLFQTTVEIRRWTPALPGGIGFPANTEGGNRISGTEGTSAGPDITSASYFGPHMRARPLLSARDPVLLLSLPFSWLLPESFWHPLTRRAAAVLRKALPRRSGFAHVTQVSAVPGFPPPEALYDSWMAGLFMEHLQDCRESRPGGWHPEIVLEGTEHLDEALQRGCGAVLWLAPTLFRSLVSKKALHAAGYRVTHLSRFDHGPSKSRLGIRYVNRIRTDAERSHLHRRLVMWPGNRAACLRALVDCVRDNGIVSLTAHGGGRRQLVRPMFDSSISLAVGPATLAVRTDATLLPVFVRRPGPGSFVVCLGPPLRVSSTGDRAVRVAALLEEFLQRTEVEIRRTPTSMRWPQLTTPGPSDPGVSSRS